MSRGLCKAFVLLTVFLATSLFRAQSYKANPPKAPHGSSGGVVALAPPPGGGGDLVPAGAYILSPSTGASFATGVAISFSGNSDTGTSFSWAFGDGTTAAGSTATKTYSAVGTYTVTFTARATGYATSSTSILITIALPAKPVISGFYATPGRITAGESTTLVFNVSGATSCNLQWGTSGMPVTGKGVTLSPLATTTYTLTATNAQGSTSASTTVIVVPAPVATSLSAAANPVSTGLATTITPVFSGGTGTIDPGIGAVTSGTAYGTGPLVMGKAYTLTVTNALGATATKTLSINIRLASGVLKWKKDIAYVGGKEVAEIDPMGTQITLEDHLGSPRLSWRGSGTPIINQKFLPFGETLSDPTSAGAFTKGYTNHQQTDLSGLIYMQARFYAPWYGRFLSPDPARDQHFEETQSWNIYSYVQNSPVMHFDPNGMEIRLADEKTMKQWDLYIRRGLPVNERNSISFVGNKDGSFSLKTLGVTNQSSRLLKGLNALENKKQVALVSDKSPDQGILPVGPGGPTMSAKEFSGIGTAVTELPGKLVFKPGSDHNDPNSLISADEISPAARKSTNQVNVQIFGWMGGLNFTESFYHELIDHALPFFDGAKKYLHNDPVVDGNSRETITEVDKNYDGK